MDMSCLVEKLMNDLERVTAERDQYKDEHAKYDSLKRKYDNCLDERNTWESLAVEADEKREKAEEELRDAREQLHQASTKSDALRQNLNSKNVKGVRYLPLVLPPESEMYPNEYMCQLVRILTLALPNVPTKDKSPRVRTKSFIEDILAANADAVRTFNEYDAKKRELEMAARQEGVQSKDGMRVAKFFNMEIIKKGNNHGKIRFINDAQERFLGTEASSGSDSAHGGKNEASDVTKAMLW
jgi:chromosome segregation ATPase